MRYELINKWIRELGFEIEKAKAEVNFMKLHDLKVLKRQLIKLRDGVN